MLLATSISGCLAVTRDFSGGSTGIRAYRVALFFRPGGSQQRARLRLSESGRSQPRSHAAAC